MIKKLSLYTFALLGAVVLLSSCKKEYESVQTQDDAKIADYLAKNNIVALPDPAKSGYFYVVTQPADGGTPAAEYKDVDSVRYNIVGKSMINGTVYGSSALIRNLGMPVGYTGMAAKGGGFMGLPVPAISDVIKKLRPGGSARIFLPSYLAFGKNGYPAAKIPSNEVIEFNISTYSEKQAVLDQQHIVSFLTANTLTALKDESGVHYIVTTQGTGTDPININTDVEIKYTLKMLDGTTADSGQFTSAPKSLVVGMEKMLVKFTKGAKFRLFIPSVLGYGNATNSTGSIPANSVLDFDVEIINVTN